MRGTKARLLRKLTARLDGRLMKNTKGEIFRIRTMVYRVMKKNFKGKKAYVIKGGIK